MGSLDGYRKKDLASVLCIDFLPEVHALFNSFGVFDTSTDELAVAREFANRFYSNIISLQNQLITKDSLASVLIHRYNHEMFLDFFYIFSSNDVVDRVDEFLNYKQVLNKKPETQSWRRSAVKISEARMYVPPWISDQVSLKKVYKTFSKMSHPNIISMQHNRKGEEYEYWVISDSIALSIFEIIQCFSYDPFMEMIASRIDTIHFPDFSRHHDSITKILSE